MHAGLDEAVEKLFDQKVDASGMDSYTQEMTKVGVQNPPPPPPLSSTSLF